MKPQTQKTGALDFFLNLGIIITLYSGVGFLINLLFSVINTAYPQIAFYSSQESISFPVAALIIITPVFLLLSYFVGKSEAVNPEKKNIWVRRWSIYLTMFISGAVVIGDLITLLYFFLDGQELTTAFLLKVLVVFVVLGALFGYYFSNLRTTLSSGTRSIWRIGAILLVAISIILGFSVIGSPRTQRLIRYDQQKVSDLQNIQNQVVSYWQTKGVLPTNLEAMKDSLSYFGIPTDPQTKAPYSYSVTTKTAFELCATFNLDARNYQTTKGYSGVNYYGDPNNENWAYKKGEYCFQRTIDPQRYPVAPTPVPKY
jgi:type III secretory pathway component EscS